MNKICEISESGVFVSKIILKTSLVHQNLNKGFKPKLARYTFEDTLAQYTMSHRTRTE